MACPNFPQGKLKEIIERTNETGNEHGFVVCGDGTDSKIVSGSGSQMSISDAVEECDLSDGPIDVVHTHPNGVARLSDKDRDVGAVDDVESVCVAVEGGEVYCERVEASECEVSV